MRSDPSPGPCFQLKMLQLLLRGPQRGQLQDRARQGDQSSPARAARASRLAAALHPAHHCAEHHGRVAIRLHVLLAEGFHHGRVRLQEEPRQLLANQVLAAVPQETAGFVVSNQDLRRCREDTTSPAVPDSQEQSRGRHKSPCGSPGACPLPAEPPTSHQRCRQHPHMHPDVSTSQTQNLASAKGTQDSFTSQNGT